MRQQMKRRMGLCGVLLMTLLVSACSTMKIDTIPVTDQRFLVEEYFLGKTRAHGIVMDRGGSPMRYFQVQIEGSWDEQTQTLTLDEDFLFDDGEVSQRIWKIRREGDGRYSGQAADVDGVAKGFSRGNDVPAERCTDQPRRDAEVRFPRRRNTHHLRSPELVSTRKRLHPHLRKARWADRFAWTSRPACLFTLFQRYTSTVTLPTG